jgi:hypothetical protein
MDGNDRRAIEDLFTKLDEVEKRSPPRDRDAEALIQSAIERAPAVPYYMAQTIIVQQQALEEAQRRLDQYDGRGRDEGFLSGLFGGRSRQSPQSDRRIDPRPAAGPWGPGYGGGGFLAGAAQTAMGVAGGILLGNLIVGAFAGGSAQAADSDRSDDRDDRSDSDDRSDDNGGADDGGTDFADAGDLGGDFGGGGDF